MMLSEAPDNLGQGLGPQSLSHTTENFFFSLVVFSVAGTDLKSKP